jgi:hypothetical protein
MFQLNQKVASFSRDKLIGGHTYQCLEHRSIRTQSSV